LIIVFHGNYIALVVLTCVLGLKKILDPQCGQTNLFLRSLLSIFFSQLKHLYVMSFLVVILV